MTNFISKFALLAVILAILYLLISDNLFSNSPFVIAGQFSAIALSIWARRNFVGGKFSIHAQPVERPLLMTGPYQFIRHPMYTSALLLIWSSVLGHLSGTTIIVGLIISGFIAVRIMVEEQLLQNNYADYAGYVSRTKRIIPFLI